MSVGVSRLTNSNAKCCDCDGGGSPGSLKLPRPLPHQPQNGKSAQLFLMAGNCQIGPIISGRVGSLRRLDRVEVARLFRRARCF
jgi:hypothetical protein